MPRTGRLEAPGVVQHIRIRGIERWSTFRDDTDGEEFLARQLHLSPPGVSYAVQRGEAIVREQHTELVK